MKGEGRKPNGNMDLIADKFLYKEDYPFLVTHSALQNRKRGTQSVAPNAYTFLCYRLNESYNVENRLFANYCDANHFSTCLFMRLENI